MIRNAVKHFKLITKHKIIVFKLCVKAGIPVRGLLHDLSKYSITEFGESVRYYTGTRSPIVNCENQKGYSKAWLHHRGRNKHHYEYWYDPEAPEPTPIIPYPYVVEMICDRVAAGMVYKGKDFNCHEPLKFWENNTPKKFINEKIQEYLTKVFTQMSENGMNETLKPQKLKQWYHEYCEK